jgi:hypothetical protein
MRKTPALAGEVPVSHPLHEPELDAQRHPAFPRSVEPRPGLVGHIPVRPDTALRTAGPDQGRLVQSEEAFHGAA